MEPEKLLEALHTAEKTQGHNTALLYIEGTA